MPAPDIWAGDGFRTETLTAAINKQKYRPGQVTATGIFDEDGVTTTRISIEYREGKLGLVEPSARGGPGETIADEQRTKIPFDVDHYQRNDTVNADEIQDILRFGSQMELETLQSRVERKAERHAGDLEMTLEHQRIGAIKGKVTSKSGTTLHDLYTRFGITQPSAVNLALSNADADIIAKLQEDVAYAVEDALDEPYTGLHAFTGRNFHTELWRHKSVRESFLYHDGAAVLRQDVPDVFRAGGITFERYRTGKAARGDTGDTGYIGLDEARVVPVGVPELFVTRFAPPDYLEEVNTMPGLGVPYYVRQYDMQNGKGRHLEVQMNAISLCTRPETLLQLTKS